MIYFISNQTRLDLSSTIKRIEIQECLKKLKEKQSLALDTETSGFDPHTCSILSMQLGDGTDQFVIDCKSIDVSVFKELLESKLILMHNAQFDLRFLLKHNINIKNIYDTFLAECILTTGLEKRDVSLNGVTKKYVGETLDKTIRGVIHRELLSERVIIYGAKDVAFLHEIRIKQLKQISKYSLNNVLDLENEVVKVFAKMCYDGINFNPIKWLGVADQTEAYTKELEGELDKIVLSDSKLQRFVPSGFQMNLFGFEERKMSINWGSPKQKLDILTTLGLEVEGVGAAELIRVQNEHPIIPVLIKYAETAKLASAFGRDFLKFVNKNTKRIHMQIWPILNTGRISVSEPNLNQIPANHKLAPIMRASFIPTKGYKIVGGDYQGFELCIIAEFSKDPLWINTLKEGGNLHSVLASKTFNIPLDKVNDPFPLKPSLTYRKIQKTINFGLAYGMSEYKLSNTMGVSVEEAKKVIDSFFAVVPKVKEFLDALAKMGQKRGFIRTSQPYGRIRWFETWQILQSMPNHENRGKWLGQIARRSMNTPIQGSNGDIIKLALINTQKEINRNNWPVRILLSIYDRPYKVHTF